MKKTVLLLLLSAFILPAIGAELASEPFDYPAGDIIGQEGINDDCTVDIADIALMAAEWLSVQYY
ncbi:hypothetical protein SMSP2_02238 [Limihaloglobus sulfuriphilus]|uniref:Dockerin domain-containing protein n=1 Tax=Limihaloglobus sulfuriphilus TaxID=1851148 RepID=A0A1Q2MGT3_9BACT|nr:hypothetical protein [Limihaloglobus sulfuriphilus]AQQ71859.1 hypothetical protein SMSP2_02238 [Limihaloglobus sulfuriphilus]